MRRSRRAARPSSSPWPIAFSTWLGPTLPDEQADPADSATPARSKAICAVSAFMPGNGEEYRVGKPLGACAEDLAHRAPASARSASMRVAHARAPRPCRPAPPALRAPPRRNRRSPARFSVPARWPFSWPPPRDQRRRHHQVGRGDEGAGALRSADLVRGQDRENRHNHLKYRAECGRPPARRRRTSTPPAALTIAAISATGWMTPVSLLAAWIATSGRPSARSWRCERRAQRAEIEHAVAVDRRSPRRCSARKRPPASRQGWSAAET